MRILLIGDIFGEFGEKVFDRMPDFLFTFWVI